MENKYTKLNTFNIYVKSYNFYIKILSQIFNKIFIIASLSGIIAGCINPQPQIINVYNIPSETESKSTEKIKIREKHIKKIIPPDPIIQQSMNENSELYKDSIVISLDIKGNSQEDEMAVQYIKDAIREKILDIEGINFKVLESKNIETDFLLCAGVTLHSYMTHDGKHVADLTISNFKLTTLYSIGSYKERSSILSASIINTHQQAFDQNRALKLSSVEAMLKLEKKKFFKRLASNKIINQWCSGSWLFTSGNSEKEIKDLKNKMKMQFLEISKKISGIEENQDKQLKAYEKKISLIEEKIDNIPVKTIIKEKKVVYRFSKKDTEEISYGKISGVKIKINSGVYTPIPSSKIIEPDGMYELDCGYKLDNRKKIDLSDDYEKKWGETPNIIEAYANGNNIILSKNNIYKLLRIERNNKGILKNPGILVIY